MMHVGRSTPGDFWRRNGGTVPRPPLPVSFLQVTPSVDGVDRSHDMDLIEYFERQKQRCERELKYADAPGFQLFERTPQGEQDITTQHIQQLREARDEYQRMIEYLRAQD